MPIVEYSTIWPTTRRLQAIAAYETHLSTEQVKTKAAARISGTHANACRTPSLEDTAGQGPQTLERLRKGPVAISGACFGRAQRLGQYNCFRAGVPASERSGDELFLVLAEPNGLPHARLGIAVPKKKVRLAVARNRLKRVVRESFRQHKGILAGLDILVIVSQRASVRSNADLSTGLKRHWRRIRLRG